MKKLFIGNLPSSTTEKDLQAVLSQYGVVRSMKLATDIFTGQCKGFALVEMEGHEARAVIENLDGRDFNGKPMKVKYEIKGGRRKRR